MHAQPLPILLLTRPVEGSRRVLERVSERLGREVPSVIAPLFEIEPIEVALPNDAAKRQLIFSSKNGVQRAAALGLQGQAWCVGDETARFARAAGFEAHSASGTADDLVALVQAHAKGALMHVRGEMARGDIAPRLTRAGFDCLDFVTYRQKTVRLCASARAALQGPEPVVVPLFSPQTAARFAEENVVCNRVSFIAMSAAVREALGREARIVAHPDLDHMIDAIISIMCGIASVDRSGGDCYATDS